MSDAVRHNAANEHDSSSLRSTIEWLRAEGHLLETEKEVDPDLKLTGLQKHLDGGSPIRLVKARMVDAWALADAIGEAAAWQIRPHAEMGPIACYLPAMALSATPPAVGATAPLLGQHNDYVFAELLGLSQAEIETYQASGVFGA
ncbi:MAG: hypothetical protein QGG75_14525 [Alphaproteobacteria bacterium]|jgi:hypothetical protein|nr:hypothetical protein [Alphaproteobacteria bacterium]